MPPFIRQIQPNNFTCSHTCLAMLINEPVQYVIDWFKDMNFGPLDGESNIIFLAHHGIYLATYARPVESDKYLIIDSDGEINITFKFNNRPFLLIVKSERFPGKLHSVIWDGEKILDPSSNSKPERDIGEYQIVEIWPIIVTKQRWESYNERKAA